MQRLFNLKEINFAVQRPPASPRPGNSPLLFILIFSKFFVGYANFPESEEMEMSIGDISVEK